jgi:uncharacterized alkaline shock family protein YloU
METPGHSLVTRRAIIDIVRDTTLNSYGVIGFASRRFDRVLGRLGLAQPGIDVRLAGGLSIALELTVAYGLPIAEVARQVDSAVRYGIRRTLGREVDRLTIHVDGVAYTAGVAPLAAIRRDTTDLHAGELSDRGTDVA